MLALPKPRASRPNRYSSSSVLVLLANTPSSEARGFRPSITFVSALSSLLVRPISKYMLRLFGFGSVLLWSAVIGSAYDPRLH